MIESYNGLASTVDIGANGGYVGVYKYIVTGNTEVAFAGITSENTKKVKVNDTTRSLERSR